MEIIEAAADGMSRPGDEGRASSWASAGGKGEGVGLGGRGWEGYKCKVKGPAIGDGV